MHGVVDDVGQPVKVVHLGPGSADERDADEVKHDHDALRFSDEWDSKPCPRSPDQRISFPDTVRVKAIHYRVFNLSVPTDSRDLGEIELEDERFGRYEIIGQPKEEFAKEHGGPPTWFVMVHYREFEFKKLMRE